MRKKGGGKKGEEREGKWERKGIKVNIGSRAHIT